MLDTISVDRDLDRLDVDAAEALLRTAETGDLEALLRRAAAVRDAEPSGHAANGMMTYSRKVFVPLTTLCRDRCHYCAFVDTPGQLLKKRQAMYMTPERVLAVARQGAALGCKEALLTLGDRPEDRWPEARAWLDEHGYRSTIHYVAEMAALITRETGMLAHANPGVMTRDELEALRPVCPSMGMMLETTSRRLFEEPGQVHYGSPDKDPELRLRVIAEAGELRIPFTTGILVGIGETVRDRAESLIALRDLHERYGHVQEVIVQNFRAKPQTAMRDRPDAEQREYLAAVAVARIVFGGRMRIQVPPNLSDEHEIAALIAAGADDWGGVSPLTADHVNPERPWPHLDDLRAATAEGGFALRERLTAQPEYVRDVETWIAPELRGAVDALADEVTGLARTRTDGGLVRPTPAPAPAGAVPPSAAHHRVGGDGEIAALAERAATTPASLDDAEWVRLLEARGPALEALATAADEARRFTVGEAITVVTNRNLDLGALRREPRRLEIGIDQVRAIASDAWQLGATELCLRGRLAADQPTEVAFEAVRAAATSEPLLHLHAFTPQDVVDLAERGGTDIATTLDALHRAGVGTLPGTGVKILDEDLRRRLAPDDVPIERWIETIETAHRRGIRTSSVIVYGLGETAGDRVRHLRQLAAMQLRAQASGEKGFTEIVPMPALGTAQSLDEHRAMFAVTRLLLGDTIRHVQAPWTRLGLDGTAAVLGSGADDLGGTLFDGRIAASAGAEAGRELPVTTAARIAGRLFRPLRQRTTDYGEPSDERKAFWR